jgi:hypothetical protein
MMDLLVLLLAAALYAATIGLGIVCARLMERKS